MKDYVIHDAQNSQGNFIGTTVKIKSNQWDYFHMPISAVDFGDLQDGKIPKIQFPVGGAGPWFYLWTGILGNEHPIPILVPPAERGGSLSPVLSKLNGLQKNRKASTSRSGT